MGGRALALESGSLGLDAGSDPLLASSPKGSLLNLFEPVSSYAKGDESPCFIGLL